VASSKGEDIRNVALIGHSGSGKTILAEAMLLKGGILKRLGKVEDGTTASDSDADEKETQKSLYASILHTAWQGREVNLIDTPGSADFIGQIYSALSAVELALITVNATYGIEIGTRKAWELAQQQGCACMFVITRMDAENAQFDEVVAALQETVGSECTPVMLPGGSGSSFEGVVNLLRPEGVPDALQDTVEERRGTLMESVMMRCWSDISKAKPFPRKSWSRSLRRCWWIGPLCRFFAVLPYRTKVSRRSSIWWWGLRRHRLMPGSRS
jgi:elongation factor G